MDRPESILISSRGPRLPAELQGIPVSAKMAPFLPLDEQIERGKREAKTRAWECRPRVRIPSQFAVVPRRPRGPRDQGRFKDSSIANRPEIVGDAVIRETQGAAKEIRYLPEYTRFV